MNGPAGASRRLAIIGSGVAGLCAALQAVVLGGHPVLLTKDRLGGSNSELAQGGLSAVTATSVARGDSVTAHVADTLKAGAGHCEVPPVEEMCAQAEALVAALESYAVQFDRDEAGTYQLGLEAAHSAHRILHINGDATGAGLVEQLVAAVRQREAAGQLTVLEEAMATQLLLEDQAVAGISYLRQGTALVLDADAVLLATGGLGQLYAATTNPQGATADGIGLAARAGAVISDAEFIQFHPTLVDPDQHPGAGMISEAVRGEGAVLVNELGDRFMKAVHPDAELAPRDVVARDIHAQLQAGHRVYLDARDVEAERGTGFLATRFPSITARMAGRRGEDRGLDLARDLVPVVAAQHYSMGGIHTDASGRTSVPGLYAAGECANTTVHGANRLASNSLLEAMVFARHAVSASMNDDPQEVCPLDGVQVRELAASRPEAPLDLPGLQAAASAHLGVHRTGSSLEELARRLARSAPVAESARAQAELHNLWITARIITAGALARTASLGAHHRLDAPEQPAQDTGAPLRHGWKLSPGEQENHDIMSKELNA